MIHVRTDLEYLYEPFGFFETEEAFTTSQGTLQLSSGRAVFTLSQPIEIDQTTAEQFTEIVRTIFIARQLLNHNQFKLLGPNVVHHGPDGQRGIVILTTPIQFKMTGFPTDIIIYDETGRVIADTRAERIAQNSNFVQSIATKVPFSPTLRRMLASYSAAVNDPTDELVHLFEILDALKEHFGNEESAIKGLGITKSDWNVIAKLANSEPIKEGRHRGNKSSLRPATDVELHNARKMAKNLINLFSALVN